MDQESKKEQLRFTGQVLLPVPKTVRPINTLAVPTGKHPVMLPYDSMYGRHIIKEGLQYLPQPGQTKRVDQLDGDEQFITYLRRFLSLALESEAVDLWFSTIALRPGESFSSAIDNFFKRHDRNPLWVGVYVPANAFVPVIEHIHLIVALPFDARSLSRFVTFEAERNRRTRSTMPRSVDIRWAYGIAGLASYLCSRKNLGAVGAKSIACRHVKTLSRPL